MEITQENNNPHPAPYPVEFASRCIQSTNAEIILGPFIGSGTTAIAALKHNRKYISIDISPDYCKYSRDLIKKFAKLGYQHKATHPANVSDNLSPGNSII